MTKAPSSLYRQTLLLLRRSEISRARTGRALYAGTLSGTLPRTLIGRDGDSQRAPFYWFVAAITVPKVLWLPMLPGNKRWALHGNGGKERVMIGWNFAGPFGGGRWDVMTKFAYLIFEGKVRTSRRMRMRLVKAIVHGQLTDRKYLMILGYNTSAHFSRCPLCVYER